MKSLKNNVFIALAMIFTFSYSNIYSQVEINPGNIYGGEIIPQDETESPYMYIQPDFEGTGGYFDVRNGNNFRAFTVNGRSSFTDLQGTVTIGGTGNGEAFFDNSEFGDDFLVLSTDAINNTEILNEAGAVNAFLSATSTFGTTPTVIVTQTLIAPTDGYALVIGSGQLNLIHAINTTTTGVLSVSDSNTSIGIAQDVAFGVPAGSASGSFFLPASVHGIFEVTAGANDFYFLGDRTGNNSVSMNDANLSVIFIPTSYGTVTGNLVENDSGKDELETISVEVTRDMIEERKRKSIEDNQRRMQAEIDELKAVMKEIRSTDIGGNGKQ